MVAASVIACALPFISVKTAAWHVLQESFSPVRHSFALAAVSFGCG
jgi:hypothetical protein